MSIEMVRDVDLATMEVCVYKNLNRGGSSITAIKGNDQRGLLLAHANGLVLVGCRMVVNEAARRRIARGGYREVCAWVIGKLADPGGYPMQPRTRVTFHPREHNRFIRVDTGADILAADAVRFDATGNAWLL